MAAPLDRLYALLPAVYRERDAAGGYPLRGLLRIVAEQAGLVENDIQGLWDDLFVETCQPWVIPYLGDLVPRRGGGLGVSPKKCLSYSGDRDGHNRTGLLFLH